MSDPSPGTQGPMEPAAGPADPVPAPRRLSQTMLEALMANTEEGVALLGPDGKLTWASANVSRIFGVPAAELIDLSGLDLVHPLDRRRVAAELAGLSDPGSIMRSEFRIVLDDKVRWVAVTVENRLHEAEVNSLVGNFRDITTRKESEVAVRLEATLLASSGQAITALDPEGVVNYWNGAAEAIYGWTAEEAIGRRTEDLVPVAQGWDRLGAAAVAANEDGRPWSYELRVVRKDGVEIPVRATATPLLDENGAHLATTVVSYDSTEQIRHQEVAARLAAIVETSHEAIFSTDTEGLISTWNAGAAELYGYTEDEVLGQNARLLGGSGAEPLLRERFRQVLKGGRAASLTTIGRRSDGSSLHMSVSMSPIQTPGGEVIGVSVIAQDVTERVVAQQALAHQATHDPLSGLANRRLFVERLEESLQRSAESGLRTGVVFIDLDDFKVVNDRFGHIDGDLVLQMVGQRIERTVSERDTVARLGGDEYVVACDGLDGYDALAQTVRRIRDVLAAPFQVGGEHHTIHASIGMALSTTDTQAEALIRKADVAMYAAKQAGGDRVNLFDDALDSQRRRRQALAAEIDAALDLGQLHTHFQPELVLDDESLFGFEALARWTHPERGVMSPLEFIPVAEQSGAIIRLGHQVLRDACQAVARWQRTVPSRPAVVSVNLSPVQLADPGLHDLVRDALTAADVDPGKLCLEVTESALMDFGTATKALAGLKDIGVSIAIDDFGTGYSSLSRLKAFPVDFLKIDRSFVHGLGREADDEAIVAAMIGLAGSIGVEVIAEGIESTVQLGRLRELGCQLGQGYLWSRAVAEDEATECVSRAGPLPRRPG